MGLSVLDNRSRLPTEKAFPSDGPFDLRRIARTDPWAASFAAVAFFISLIMFHELLNICWQILGLSDSVTTLSGAILLYLGLVIGLLLPLVLGLTSRVRRLRKLLSEGLPVDAVVSKLVRYQGFTVAIKYSFRHEGQVFQSEARAPNPLLIRPNPLRLFSEGSEIQVAIDPLRPRRNLVANLYRGGQAEEPHKTMSRDQLGSANEPLGESSLKWRWITLGGILGWLSPLLMLVTDDLQIPTLFSNSFGVVVGLGIVMLSLAADDLAEHLVKAIVSIDFLGLLVLGIAMLTGIFGMN